MNFCFPQIFDWWCLHATETRFPNLSAFVKLAALIQPSSAASERVFSFLDNLFGDDRCNSREDLVEGSMLSRVNLAWDH